MEQKQEKEEVVIQYKSDIELINLFLYCSEHFKKEEDIFSDVLNSVISKLYSLHQRVRNKLSNYYIAEIGIERILAKKTEKGETIRSEILKFVHKNYSSLYSFANDESSFERLAEEILKEKRKK